MRRSGLDRWAVIMGCAVTGAIACMAGASGQPPTDKLRTTTVRNAPAPPPFCGIGVVFVANGAGGEPTLTENLTEALRAARMPLAVDTTHWSLNRGSIVDHTSSRRHVEAGAWMAAKVQAFRKAYPDRLVILMGHSSGTDVVLRAAEMLPENSVDRIVLLAPSVACNFDLRQALRSTRGGIDVYWSSEDGVLELAMDYVGTADGQKGVACAGRVGFAVPPRTCPDAALYCKLHQYRWNDRLQRYGHFGGHYGWVRTRFLQQVIVPSLMVSETIVECR